MGQTQLSDKVVLVTGANSGIGAATAKAFAAEGVALVIHFLETSPPSEIDGAYTIEHSVAGRPAADEIVNYIREFVRRYQKRGGHWGRIINLSTDVAQTFAGQVIKVSGGHAL
ncbi:MAG: SDR family NAD(P)-dependent oxidoreductase [Acidobacteria bacterium]|nr:SDR family NAD(P)-dependent oxidoreductase [Acidobacteriota bacterium]